MRVSSTCLSVPPSLLGRTAEQLSFFEMTNSFAGAGKPNCVSGLVYLTPARLRAPAPLTGLNDTIYSGLNRAWSYAFIRAVISIALITAGPVSEAALFVCLYMPPH